MSAPGHRLLPRRRRLRAGSGGRCAIARRLEEETGAAAGPLAGERRRDGPPRRSRERVATAPHVRRRLRRGRHGPGSAAPLQGQPARRSSARSATVAPGNALVFLEQGDAGDRSAPRCCVALEAAVVKAGGEAKAFPAPKAGELAGWLRNLAKERGIALERDASEELARRVGGFVSEGDVDRLRQGTLAAGELDKLALYRQAAPITVDDVRALVPEVIPDSTWAMLDAVAERRVDVAGPLLDRLLDTTPLPVVIVQLHRRLRELLVAADLVAEGRRPPDIVKAIGGAPVPGPEARGAGAALDAAGARRRARGRAGARRDDQGGGRTRGRRSARCAWRSPCGCATASRRRVPPEAADGALVGGGPGLFLEDDVALDREHAAALAEVQQVDQLGIDVQLVAVLAQAARDPEAQPLRLWSGSRKVVSKRVMTRRRLQPGQRSRKPDIGASPGGVGPPDRRLAPDARRRRRAPHDPSVPPRAVPLRRGWRAVPYWTRRTVRAPDQWRSSW